MLQYILNRKIKLIKEKKGFPTENKHTLYRHVEACLIALGNLVSKTSQSWEKRTRILPTGVVSKKVIGLWQTCLSVSL